VTARLLQGNEACVLGALAAGCRFFAGYPITPSSEIAERMSVELPERGGVFAQMEDEMASLGAVIGASLGGRKAMTATSGPGFTLMQEHLGYASFAEIPCVVVDVMRGGPSTGLPTRPSQGDVMQARWGTHGDHPIVVLAPASVAEVHELTMRAFALSERLRVPVILLYDEVIGHVRERVDIPDAVAVPDRARPTVALADYRPYRAGEDLVPPLAAFGTGYRFHVTGLAHDERGYATDDPAVVGPLHERLQAKLRRHRAEIVEREELWTADADVVVVAYGVGARAAKAAVRAARERGIAAGLFRPRTIWPFPDDELRIVAEHAREILVVELNLGQLSLEVERCVAGRARVRSCLRADGQPVFPEAILAEIERGAAVPAR
jgi:2-oxoglutarate/2-oxoacid ferredoxin oxidoreductase subunit alpha